MALGKVYVGHSTSPHMEVIYVVRGDEELLKDLVVATYSMLRLGCKEGLLSVKSVSYGVPEEVGADVVKTRYSFWLDIVESIRGDYVRQDVIDYRSTPIGEYSKAKFRTMAYPYSIGRGRGVPVSVVLNKSKAKALNVRGEVIIVEW